MNQFLRLIFILLSIQAHYIFNCYTHCYGTITTCFDYYGNRGNLDQIYYCTKNKATNFRILTKRNILKAKERIIFLLGFFIFLPQTRITETTDIF